MPAHLTLRFADRPAQRFHLDDGGDYLAGRSERCELRIDDPRVSRRHARLRERDGRWWVSDLASKNGVRIDGEPVEAEAALPDACWLGLGGVVARFERLSARQARERAERDRVRRQAGIELTERFDPAAGLERLLAQLLDSVLRLTGADRGFVLLGGPDGGDLAVAATAGLAVEELGATEFAGSVGAVEQALASGRPVVTTDARDDALLGARPSVAEGGIRALVCVPLRSPGGRAGVVYADSRAPGGAFTELDVGILEALASHAGLALAVAGLSREMQGIAGELPTTAEPMTWSRVVATHRGSREDG